MHSPSLRFELTGNSLRHRELSDRASSSDGSDHRRHIPPELHIPNMDSRNPSVWPPLLSQPILLVPQGASHANVDLGSDRGGSTGPPHGLDDNEASVLQRAKARVHAESRPVQRERARADHDLRELRCG